MTSSGSSTSDSCRPSPLVLAIDTATNCGGVALVDGEGCLAEFVSQSRVTYSRRLLAGIDWLMAEAGKSWEQVDGIAVSLGPGSFTGLRIGLATGKGLAMAAGAKLLGVPTLDALASQAAGACGLVCPVLDARKREVYAAFYRPGADGLLARCGEFLALPPERLCQRIDEPVLFLGDGLGPYGELFRQKLGKLARFAPASLFYPRPAAVGRLGVEQFARGEFLDLAAAAPLYVRPSEAEIHFGAARKAP